MENCQIGIFLAYGSRCGAGFLHRERGEAEVPQDVVFRAKGQLAQTMIARAVSTGVPFGWVAAGAEPDLRAGGGEQ